MINFPRPRPLIRRAFSRRTGYLDRPICGKVCLPAGTKQDAATLLYVKKLNGRAAFRLQGDNLMAEFQFQIAPLRKQHGLSQQQLAALLGVAPQTVSKWETGDSLR